MKIRLAWFAAALVCTAAACDNTLSVVVPEFPNGGSLGGTTPLTPQQKQALEGVYVVEQGNGQFGDTLVLKWNGDDLGIYGVTNYAYMIARAGATSSSLAIEGYWHFAGTETIGLVQLAMPLPATGSFHLGGAFGNGEELPSRPLELQFLRPIAPAVLARPYYIIAHRGSGSGGLPELMPVSDNTAEIAKITERYGANGIEVDVRISKDGVPFLYHDSDLNWRLTLKGGLVGPPEDYTFAQLQAGVRLIHGEQIPSLAAFLDTVITATTIAFVDLDMKPSSVNNMAGIIAVQQAALAKAAGMGRTVQIYLAMTSPEVLAAFLAQPGYQNVPTACELGIDELEQAHSTVWSPRFTQQIPASDIDRLHSEGKLAITWTVNVPTFIQQFVAQGGLDGMLSDFPGLVAYYYYKQ